VHDLPGLFQTVVCQALSFASAEEASDPGIIQARIAVLCTIVDNHASGCGPRPLQVMLGGAPWIVAPLVSALNDMRGVRPVYAFSERVSVDFPQADGTVKKVAVFKHAGFVPAR
jgi:hypothetical protein